jgi:hypothetical protein
MFPRCGLTGAASSAELTDIQSSGDRTATVPAQYRQIAIHQRAVQCHPATAIIGMIITERPITPHDQYVSYWFDSATDLAEFILDLFAYHYCGCEEDVAEELPELAAIAQRISAHGVATSTPSDVLALGELVLEYVQLRWVGTFSQLCAGRGDTEKHLIKWFRGNDDDSEVTSDELAEFVAFLNSEMLEQ